MPTASTPSTAADSPDTVYRRLWERYEGEAGELRRRSAALARGRLATFFGAVICLAPAVVGTENPRVPWLIGAGVLVAAFAALVAVDGRLARRLRRLEALRDVNTRSVARRAVDLAALAPCPPVAELFPTGEDLPAFARDLHLFGHASLFRLVSTAQTPVGRQTLARWLIEPAGLAGGAGVGELVDSVGPIEPTGPIGSAGPIGSTEVGGIASVSERQQAVHALAGRLAFRQEVEALATRVPGGEPDLDRFYAWAEGEPWLIRRPILLWSARVLTVLVPGGLVAAAAGAIPWSVWLLVAMAGYLLSAASGERLHEIYDRATAGGDGLRGYGPLFRALEALPGERPGEPGRDDPLGHLAARLRAGARHGGSEGATWAGRWMDQLERLTVLSDVRRGLIYFFVQVLTLWDFHLAARFEAWQSAAGPAVRGWLNALGEVEALGSLAALAHANPEWAWPQVGGGQGTGSDAGAGADDSFRAIALGHPLIPGDRRVGNDVEVGPPGAFLLVTGSNMSGKTTLIRSIGVNAVLAEAGGPVCARELSMPPVRLATSIVVEDSLEEGVSFFMAELLRLKSVVDAAAAEAREGGRDGKPGGRRLLYLLDEVLRGTNSAERRVAIQRVLGRLLELGAIGAITTHDLQILAEGELERSAVPIHFRETIRPRPEGGADMTFDFLARPGLAPTTNALQLLEAVGLGVGDGE